MSDTTTVEPDKKTDANTIDHLDDKTQAEIRKLREENAARRIKAKELEDKVAELDRIKAEYDKEKQRKLEEDGKLKEIIELKDKELQNFQGTKEKMEKYEKYFSDRLEAEMKGLTETQIEELNSYNLSVEEKLKWINNRKAEKGISVNSPSSERPGGGVKDYAAVIKEYLEGNLKKKSEILFNSKANDKTLYQTLMDVKS